jgi:endonuclease-3 related protein
MGVSAVTSARPSDLAAVYARLRARYGHAGWWPGDTPFEVCVGAILTQRTSWRNVEKALDVLRARGLLSYDGLRALPPHRLAPLIRAAGFFKVKSRRLAAFVVFLGREYRGDVRAMRGEDPLVLRAKLLSVAGIGPETADAIALYAAEQPLFVVDAYTRRVFARLGHLRGDEGYLGVQRFFHERLPRDPALFNDYHAQIVRLAKEACRTLPRCGDCPLDDVCAKKGLPSRRD